MVQSISGLLMGPWHMLPWLPVPHWVNILQADGVGRKHVKMLHPLFRILPRQQVGVLVFLSRHHGYNCALQACRVSKIPLVLKYYSDGAPVAKGSRSGADKVGWLEKAP